MLTSYLVRCPHFGCDWFGSLLPSRDTDSWRGSVPATLIAVFECPKCHREWRARVQGDDVKPLPVNELLHVD
jgi:hypothetical protein